MFDINTFKFDKIKNRYSGVRAYTQGKYFVDARPVELILEITNHCNLACIMCPRPNMKRDIGSMDMPLFTKIIDQVKGYIELVYLAGGLGEPTMHQDLFDMIQYCRAAKVRVGISTNATLLTSKVIDQLLVCKPDIVLLSLDGATKATHEQIRVGSKFERTMGNVENFLNEKERRGADLPYVVVQMVHMPKNQQEADLFRKKWSAYKGVNDVRMKKFLHLQGADYYPAADDSLRQSAQSSCVLPWRQISISWEGKLALCCRDYEYKEEIGSVKTHSILELWNSPAMQKYRELLSSGNKAQIKLCKGCAGFPTTPTTRLGAVLVDDLSIRRILPVVEKLALKTGLKFGDYE